MNHQRPHRKGTIQPHAESWTSEGHCEGIVRQKETEIERERDREAVSDERWTDAGGR